MQTRLAQVLQGTPDGEEAAAILGRCVHCGFCNATCPTYGLLGDELDGPRGRIYLMKRALEGATPTARTQQHLDRCLTCRACETTCPSGVQYGRLLDVGRRVVDAQVPRPAGQRAVRALLRGTLTRPMLFAALVGFGQALRPLLPAARISTLARDVVELVAERVTDVAAHARVAPAGAPAAAAVPTRVAFHPPCTLQHGLRIRGAVESVLASLGATVVPVRDAHLCCGSAGAYSLLQPALAGELRDRKLAALEAASPEVVLSANVGCIAHLAGAARVPVRHWIEWVDDRLAAAES